MVRRTNVGLLLPLVLGMLVLCGAPPAWAQLTYPLVYVRAPRAGDTTPMRIPEVSSPVDVEPGTDLVLRHADGSEDVLVSGGTGAVLDPQPSLDAQWIYYAVIPNAATRNMDYNYPNGVPFHGSDLFRIHVVTREVVRLTHREWTPSAGAGQWSSSPGSAVPTGTNYVGYYPFNLAPCPLPDGRLMFVSSRDGYWPTRVWTFPNLQLFVLDERCRDERGYPCVEKVGYLNLGSAMHPTILMDGRAMWSTAETQGLRKELLWGLWASTPDGGHWEPLMSAFRKAVAWHWQTQLSDGRLAVVGYYHQNNDGLGTLYAQAPGLPQRPMSDTRQTYFGSPVPTHTSNPPVQVGVNANQAPRMTQLSFSPLGLTTLTPFAHDIDQASDKDTQGIWMGKVTQPSGAPNNDVLLVWSSGPANHLKRPVDQPVADLGIYLLKGGQPATHPGQLIKIVDSPAYNEQQPKALVPYPAIYGIDAPAILPRTRNDGTGHPALPAGTPYGLVGTSTLYKHDVHEGRAGDNWVTQGAAFAFTNDEIDRMRLVLLEPVTHRPRGPNSGAQPRHFFQSLAQEKLRILGEIPLRKTRPDGAPLLDVDGNPDTSFLAKIPANMPFTFQALDAKGHALPLSQTWHQLRPGEVRTDCGGCHAHSQVGTAFAQTAAGRPGFPLTDLSTTAPVDLEYYRDIRPLLERVAPALAALAPATLIEQKLGEAKPVHPFRSRGSQAFLQQLTDGGATDTEYRQVAAWIDLGAPVTVHATHGWFLRETRPVLSLHVETETILAPPIVCAVGCVPDPATPPPTQTVSRLILGAASVYQTLAPATLTLWQDQVDVTAQVVPLDASRWALVLPSGQGQGMFRVTVCDTPTVEVQGNCATLRLAVQW